jgi:hypothetical protein
MNSPAKPTEIDPGLFKIFYALCAIIELAICAGISCEKSLALPEKIIAIFICSLVIFIGIAVVHTFRNSAEETAEPKKSPKPL